MNIFSKVISGLLSSKISIVIYIAMFIYLVIVPLLALIPPLGRIMPSTSVMLIGDNYTSVLAALGASIAAGTGVAAHHKIKQLNDKHDKLQKSLDDLHSKIDKLSSGK
ncbi:MAG: hypothetical protein LBM73_01625 [Candidatus Nomurabacteria bacterium]|jgi:high-affinity Fe2+/Pb2+ permease|nr:hypothetical protein [Candidatus Nomurabacteria bacterium]